jgi:hypothetical protein
VEGSVHYSTQEQKRGRQRWTQGLAAAQAGAVLARKEPTLKAMPATVARS